MASGIAIISDKDSLSKCLNDSARYGLIVLLSYGGVGLYISIYL
jgi:hypothetical protein